VPGRARVCLAGLPWPTTRLPRAERWRCRRYSPCEGKKDASRGKSESGSGPAGVCAVSCRLFSPAAPCRDVTSRVAHARVSPYWFLPTPLLFKCDDEVQSYRVIFIVLDTLVLFNYFFNIRTYIEICGDKLQSFFFFISTVIDWGLDICFVMLSHVRRAERVK